jgi:hypothetical protein
MSSSISIPNIKISASQNIRMLCAILNICQGGTVPAGGLSLHLNSVSDILDGRPINFDSMDFNENVRVYSFSSFSRSAFVFLLKAKLCKTDTRLIDAGIRKPMEVAYVKVTPFGRIFAKSPFVLQYAVIKVLENVFFSVDAIKKYRWIFSVTSIVVALIGWVKAHDITDMLIVLSIFAGFATAIFVAWIANVLGIDSDDT